jgi:hypothetical protein
MRVLKAFRTVSTGIRFVNPNPRAIVRLFFRPGGRPPLFRAAVVGVFGRVFFRDRGREVSSEY